MKNTILKKAIATLILMIFCFQIVLPVAGTSFSDEIPLPPPLSTDMILEETMARRKSVRNFTLDPVTDEELSTVLWAAYGLRDDGEYTVSDINNSHGVVIYVLKEDAAYTYNPENHSLVLYKPGDWRDIVGYQYSAPIQLGVCYNSTILDPYNGGAQVGMVDQNIQFMANALELGTVVTAQVPPAIEPLGIPQTEEGITVLPLGHPEYDPYVFAERPLWISLLPRIKRSEMTLSEALEQRNESDSFTGVLTRHQLSHIVWACSGFSYYRDKSNDPIYHKGRHRTIPSGKGYYPVEIYVVQQQRISRYQPNLLTNMFSVPVDFYGLPIITFLVPEKFGDHRDTFADACDQPSIASAPLIVLFILDREKTRPEGLPDLSDDMFLSTWYHDAGAGAHNVLLEVTTGSLSAELYEIVDPTLIKNLLCLDMETTIPIFALPVGE
jgi:hypothetical protein